MKLHKRIAQRAAACAVAAALCLSAATAVFAADAGTAASAGGNGTQNGAPPDGTPPGGTAPSGGGAAPGGAGGADTMTYDYTGALSGALTADGEAVTSDGQTTAASAADQNAALAENGGTLTVTNGTLEKSGDDSNGDNCNFYGVNAILLAVGDGSAAYVSNSSLTADSEGSNGIFATDGAVVYASGDTISTTADNARGLDATYGGTILADGMTIDTQGDHCAAAATDRGGGSVSVTNSTLSTAGSGSPLLYSTGDIEADNVTGTASGSQIAGMEGLNTILIRNSQLSSTLTGATASDPIADGVILYQSTSGDAESATGEAATFQAVDSTLTSAIQSGAMFYVTNTAANVLLSGTTLEFDTAKANLLTVEGNDANSWGTAGSNGGTVTFTALGETLAGDIRVDTISSLDLYLLENTVYTGAMTISENAVNTAAAEAPITVNLDGTSKWVVTGDTTITNLNAAEGAQIVDADGGTVTIVANGKTVAAGTGAYTVTVTGSYSNTVTTSDANTVRTQAIDRTAFDSYYGTSTAFGTNGTAAAQTSAASVSAASSASAADSGVQADGAGSTASAAPRGLYAGLGAAALLAAGGWALARRRKKKG